MIETNDEYPFVTSDNIINVNNSGMPPGGFYQPTLAMPGSYTYIPISKELTLLLINNEQHLDGKVYSLIEGNSTNNFPLGQLKLFIKNLNKITYRRCNKYVFASSDDECLRKCFSKMFSEARRYEEMNNAKQQNSSQY